MEHIFSIFFTQMITTAPSGYRLCSASSDWVTRSWAPIWRDSSIASIWRPRPSLSGPRKEISFRYYSSRCNPFSASPFHFHLFIGIGSGMDLWFSHLSSRRQIATNPWLVHLSSEFCIRRLSQQNNTLKERMEESDARLLIGQFLAAYNWDATSLDRFVDELLGSFRTGWCRSNSIELALRTSTTRLFYFRATSMFSLSFSRSPLVKQISSTLRGLKENCE